MWSVVPRRTEGGTVAKSHLTLGPPSPRLQNVDSSDSLLRGIQVTRCPCPSERRTWRVALQTLLDASGDRARHHLLLPSMAVITVTADGTSRHGTHLDICFLSDETRVPTVITGERAVDTGWVCAAAAGVPCLSWKTFVN